MLASDSIWDKIKRALEAAPIDCWAGAYLELALARPLFIPSNDPIRERAGGRARDK